MQQTNGQILNLTEDSCNKPSNFEPDGRCMQQTNGQILNLTEDICNKPTERSNFEPDWRNMQQTNGQILNLQLKMFATNQLLTIAFPFFWFEKDKPKVNFYIIQLWHLGNINQL